MSPTPYKKVYSPEELNELREWIVARIPTMPKSLQLNDATFIADLPATAGYYVENLDLHRENPTYGGQLLHLFRIREKLEEMEKEG